MQPIDRRTEFRQKFFNGPAPSILLFITGFIVRICCVSGNQVAMDEPFSIYYSQMDLSSIFAMLKTENNPALHFLLLHFWIKMFGISAFSVRFLSVLFSALTLPVIYETGRKFFSKTTGITASLLFLLSAMHTAFAHEARSYSLFCFLAALSFYCFLLIRSEPLKKLPYIWLVVVDILMVYTHYFGFFVLFVQAVSLALPAVPVKMKLRILLVFMVIAIAYIPNLIIFFQRMTISVSNGTWVKPPQVTELYGNINRFLNGRIAIPVILIAILTVFIIQYRRNKLRATLRSFTGRPELQILFIWFFVPYLVMFAVSYKVPMFLDRYILFTSLFLYLLIVEGIVHFSPSPRIKWLFPALLLIAMIPGYSLNPSNKRRPDLAAKAIHERPQGSLVFISPDYTSLEFCYHYNRDYFTDYRHTSQLLNSEGIFPVREITLSDFPGLKTSHNIIFLDCGSEFAFGKNSVKDTLDKHFTLKDSAEFESIYTLRYYSQKKQ